MADGLVPKPVPETAPFWDAAKDERLLIQRCNSCGRHYFYPRPFCPHCASDDVTWDEVSGHGRLVSYVINYRPLPPAEGAQIIALVQLDEGVRLLTNIVGATPDPAALTLDAPVTVAFQQRGEYKLPVFRLVDAA